MKDFIDYVIDGDENDELAKTKAELAYALHALERELAIAQSAQAQLVTARELIEGLLGLELGSSEKAMQFLAQTSS